MSYLPADVSELRTLTDLVRWGASRFNEHELYFGHGTDNAV
ncbi:MAG: 50S ribosomal protein L3 N(5)-glutamine methyltransferase, partial [Granulosicoccaceae bacterium]